MASNKIAIKVEGVSKYFKLPQERTSSLKQAVLSFRKRKIETFKVLSDISFEVREGEFFGVLGRNGSGKSTLLKLLAGIYSPTHGKVQVNGTLTPFIELGVGFNPELTGRENVFLNGAILGLTKKEIEQKYQDIVGFAELERFMGQKLKNYSSGMQVRLAFAIAIQAHNNILLIDEVLAVGDANFQRKCLGIFHEIKRAKKTVVFISHDMGLIEKFCDRAFILEDGKIALSGKPSNVILEYNRINIERGSELKTESDTAKRWGEGGVTITKTWVGDKHRRSVHVDPEQKVDVYFEAKAEANIVKPIYGITIKDQEGHPVFATNTHVLKQPTKNLKPGDKVRLHWQFENRLNDGNYYVCPAIADQYGENTYDWIEEACYFEVSGWPLPYGATQLKHTVEVKSL